MSYKPCHTPGPWEVNTEAGRPNREVFAGDVLICDCGLVEIDHLIIEANARLIAAAPDLLEACKLALDDWDMQEGCIARKKLEEAIRKAEISE